MISREREEIMALTPEKYVEVSFNLFERLSSRIPGMMVRIKDELAQADSDERESIIKAHLFEERKAIEQELLPVNFDDLMQYEQSASDDIKKFLDAHPDIKKNMDAMLVRFKEQLRQ
nr:hypothetical protein [Candidatus Sigynarchaeota archaeon]